jgi:endonuclease YncB( thermonuclease family)
MRGCRYEMARGEFTGNVVGVHDGDTITVLHNGRGEKIRLYGIDCPELAQPWGRRAKEFASDAVFDKTVTVRVMDTDRYGRTVGEVYYDGKNLNQELVQAGLAWAYVHFTEKYAGDEEIAREQHRGLWADPSPEAPWDFRRNGQRITRPGRGF